MDDQIFWENEKFVITALTIVITALTRELQKKLL